MRAGRVAIFAFGFAAGMAVLAVVLWVSGALHAPSGRPVQAATTTVVAPPGAMPAPAPTAPASPLPEAPAISPSTASSAPAAIGSAPVLPPHPPGSVSKGEAERLAPERTLDHPIIPVQGVKAAQLTDTFNSARGARKHEALDIMAPRNTPVIAAVEGNVVKLFHSKLGGVTVYQFDDSQQYCYYYAHLDRYAPGLTEGTLLRQGQVLGYVGSTGNASAEAPHLHFEVHKLGPEKKWWQGEPLNPFGLLR